MMPSTALPPSTLEAGLISSITSVERLTQVQIAGVQHSDFAVWHGVYGFILEYSAQYGGVPSPALIKSKWEEWSPPLGDFDYWLQEFVKRSTALKAEKLIRDAIADIEKNPNAAIPELISKLAGVQYLGNTHIVATDATIKDRLEKFRLRKQLYEESNGNYLLGIPTGFSVIDQTRQGWMPGELIGFYARPTVGKTWMLVREAAVAWAAGYRVLLISPEVNVPFVSLRIDTFLGHYSGIPLSHSRIMSGDPSQEANYARLAEHVAQSERWWTVDSLNGKPLGLKDIRTFIKQLSPDLVCIDGVMLLHDDEGGKSSWEKMDNVCYGLKNLATAYDIAILMSHQSINSRKGQRSAGGAAQGRGDDWVMPTLNDAAGGEAFVRACTTIFTMCPDLTHANARWYSIRKSRERAFKEWKPRYCLLWDVDCGHIEDLSKYGEDMIVIEQMLGTISYGH